MIYKMTSSKAVIAKVIADLGLNETEIPITDIKQWIGESLMNIGSVSQLDHKVAVIPINGYQAKLPCDLERLNSVAYSTCDCGGWIPMKKSTGTFSVYDKKDNCDCCNMIIHDDVLIPLVKNLHNLTKDKDALEVLNKDTNTRQTLSALINNYTVCSKNGRLQHTSFNGTNFSYTPQYDVKPGYLISNVPEGYAKISYHAIYTDEDGMPMIPDVQSYFEACFWYCAQKILYIKYIKGKELSYHAEKPKVYIMSNEDRTLYADDNLDIISSGKHYRSIHYIIRYNEFYFEIQVRTLFEEGWLEFDHLIKYPNDQTNKKKQEYADILSSIAVAADRLISFYDDEKFPSNDSDPKGNNLNTNISDAPAIDDSQNNTLDDDLRKLFQRLRSYGYEILLEKTQVFKFC